MIRLALCYVIVILTVNKDAIAFMYVIIEHASWKQVVSKSCMPMNFHSGFTGKSYVLSLVLWSILNSNVIILSRRCGLEYVEVIFRHQSKKSQCLILVILSSDCNHFSLQIFSEFYLLILKSGWKTLTGIGFTYWYVFGAYLEWWFTVHRYFIFEHL